MVKNIFLSIVLALLIGFVISNLLKSTWTGIYYKGGSLSNPIYSQAFSSKNDCIAWAVSKQNSRPEDKTIKPQELWECSKNCKLDKDYQYLQKHAPEKIVEGRLNPVYTCDEGFDGGDWIRGDY